VEGRSISCFLIEGKASCSKEQNDLQEAFFLSNDGLETNWCKGESIVWEERRACSKKEGVGD